MHTRRTILRWGVALAATLRVSGALAGTALQSSPNRRPFRWVDAYRRSEVERAAISSNGYVAVQVTRPMAAGGSYGGISSRDIQPRGEIWLLNDRLDAPIRLFLGDLWSWAPSFSPRGTRLAALISRGDGRVGLVVWELPNARARVFLKRSVDISGHFSCDGKVEGQPSIEGQMPKQFAWLDDETLLFLQTQTEKAQFELDITNAARTYASLWRRTSSGGTSVRVWSDSSPVCGAGLGIAKFDCKTGAIETIYRGAVRGVSISPDRRWLAALIAANHLKLAPDEPMSPGLRYFSIGDDPLVSLSLVRIDLTGQLPPAGVAEFCGVGVVAPRRLPVWASDSQSFAVPARCRYASTVSAGDVCWQVEAATLHVRRWDARSALDAELMAALLASIPESAAHASVTQRTELGRAPAMKLRVTQGEGSVWSYGRSYVALWDRTTITLMGPAGSATVPGAYSAVYAPEGDSAVAFLFAVRQDGQGCVLRLSGIECRIVEVGFAAGYDYLGILAADGTVIAKEDADSETRLITIASGREARVSPLAFNRYFREVDKPEARELTYRAKNGMTATGVLQLPVGRSRDQRHPVILWAYPDQQASLSDWLTRLNSMMAVWRPIQYLLTRGFAILHAPLSTTMRMLEPLDLVTQCVLPWLDILDEQPDILAGEYGFFGHSNAGYVALGLEARTARFKAIVAYATFPDLGAYALSGVPDKMATQCGGQVIQADRFYFEDSTQPYGLGEPFWQDPQKFIRNSPLYQMRTARTPLLLLQGEFDYGPRAMESVFSILEGRGIPVELAYYWGEGHLISSPGNLRDMWQRTERFYRKYLKVTN
jgi:hypothetical protein